MSDSFAFFAEYQDSQMPSIVGFLTGGCSRGG